MNETKSCLPSRSTEMRKALLAYAHPVGINYVIAYFHPPLTRRLLGRVTGYLIGRMEPSMKPGRRYISSSYQQKSFLPIVIIAVARHKL